MVSGICELGGHQQCNPFGHAKSRCECECHGLLERIVLRLFGVRCRGTDFLSAIPGPTWAIILAWERLASRLAKTLRRKVLTDG